MNEPIFAGVVLRLAFGGEGIVHHIEPGSEASAQHKALVVFVPFTAPGDHIQYRIVKRKKTFAYGELVALDLPSQERITPKCPYFGTCGGCQLQHLSYPAQLKTKRQNIEDALHRQAKFPSLITPPVTAAFQQWAYRRKISLTLKPHQDHFLAGYRAQDNHFLPIQQCPIFTAPDDPIISEVQALSSTLKRSSDDEGKVTLLKREDSTFLLHFHFKKLPQHSEHLFSQAQKRNSSWTGLVVSSPEKTMQWGEVETTLHIEGLSFTFSPKTFIQNHPEQSLNIYHSLVKHASSLQPRNLIDLYCGIGISSLLLSRLNIAVTGVENNGQSIRLAKANAAANHLAAEFIHADVADVLEKLLQKKNPDLVIVNPPREGLDPKVIEILLKHPPKALIYVSCMPPTLARDLQLLCADTYCINTIEPFDMFPQTAHVETLVLCTKKNSL